MNTSQPPTNGNKRGRRWFRRGHRWIGLSLVVFVLYLSVSGILLNHAGDLRLESRYVSWSWLLDAYGLQVPEPAASFADSGYRSTLLGERLFLNGRDTGQRDSTLTGIAALGPLVLIGGEQHVYLFTADGEFVEAIDLSAVLNGSLERVGRAGNRAVVQSAGNLYRSDADVAMFETWNDTSVDHWSAQSPPGAEAMQVLQAAWRGKGVTVERLVLDLHSGRLFGRAGPLLMDLVAVLLIVLSLSGLVMYKVRSRRK
jgi:hypothetical protein